MANLYTLASATRLSVSLPNPHVLPTRRRFHLPLATLASSSSPESSASSTPSSISVVNGNTLSSSYGTRDKVVVDDNSLFARFFRSTESTVEKVSVYPLAERLLGPVLVTRFVGALMIPIQMSYRFIANLSGLSLSLLLNWASILINVTGLLILQNKAVTVGPAGAGIPFSWSERRLKTAFLPGISLLPFGHSL
ncbi:hypothetical protein F2Q68_00022821 [Brassica cretica]|uniref:Uncharacterized protein n=1 Tax=Brassica cretica TaxID=69181 RepID=A0A8S9FWF1_BRACR|nr:hypothetical protein F2Q68_00022821 [Brassica cretica]